MWLRPCLHIELLLIGVAWYSLVQATVYTRNQIPLFYFNHEVYCITRCESIHTDRGCVCTLYMAECAVNSFMCIIVGF